MNLLTQIDELDRAIENGSPKDEVRNRIRVLREKIVEEEARPIDEMIDIMPSPELPVRTYVGRLIIQKPEPLTMDLPDDDISEELQVLSVRPQVPIRLKGRVVSVRRGSNEMVLSPEEIETIISGGEDV